MWPHCSSFKIAISVIVVLVICSTVGIVRGAGPSTVQIDSLKPTVYAATWNVDSQKPTDALNLSKWLLATNEIPDIYAIGIQEVILTPTAIVANEDTPDSDWIDKLLLSVKPKGEYIYLDSVRLVGLMLTVIVRKDFLPKIEKISSATVATGKMNLGNKGGVGISVRINGVHLCFINSHLAAHDDAAAQRKKDYDAIESKMLFKYVDTELAIKDHQYKIWFGDLNYRLDSVESREYLRQAVSNIGYAAIVSKHDQLRRVMNSANIEERAFVDYKEGSITFPPTFKYDLHTDEWDSSKKQRMPAWCDRILWKADNPWDIQQLIYNSVTSLRTSDHRAVYALFRITIKAKSPGSVAQPSVHTKERKWRRIRNRMSKVKHSKKEDDHSTKRRWRKFKNRMLHAEDRHSDAKGAKVNGPRSRKPNKRRV